MIALLRQRNFALLWFGGLISFTGDWILFVALPLYAYNLTGSVLATGAIFIINTIPGLLFSSVAGVYVDRWDRKTVLIVSNALRGVVVLIFMLATTADTLWIIYIASFVSRTLSQFTTPAEHALLPKLVDESQLVKANALNSLNNNLARLLGPAIGGVIVTVWGFTSTVIIDAISFWVVAGMVALIAAPSNVTRAQREEGEEAVEGKSSVFQEWREGLSIVARSRAVSALFILMGLSMLAEGFFSVLIAIFTKESLGGGEVEFGWILTAQAVGGLIGGLFIGKFDDRFTPRQLVIIGFLMLGICDGIIFLSGSLAVAIIFMVIVGVPVVGLQAGAMTIFQTAVADRFRGRVMGAFGTTQSLIMIISMSFASFFGSELGVVPLLTVGALFNLLAGVAAIYLLPRAVEEAKAASVPLSSGLAGNTTSD
jgi:MFS family permease